MLGGRVGPRGLAVTVARHQCTHHTTFRGSMGVDVTKSK